MKQHYIMDSYQMDSEDIDIIKRLKLEKYFTIKNDKWIPDFVGFILTEEEMIISFPKHYSSKSYKIKDEDISLISKLMVETRNISGLNNEAEEYDNFPLSSYLYICNYYKKHGLYVESRNKKENNYKGRIDWRNTIRRSNKLISDGNLIFLPFVIEKNISLEVFITECMIYSLEEGFNRFGKFFNVGININKKSKHIKFKNKEIVIKQLNLLKADYFKDSELLLIDHLINYFRWSNNNGDKTTLITKDFSTYWEKMIENYMNTKLKGIEKSGELIFEEKTNNYKFEKKSEYIESEKLRSQGESRSFRVEYDHLCIMLDGTAYLFDSKYFKEVKTLDYKQLAYYFILKSSDKYLNKKIVNGLILPTEKKYNCRVHLDTRDTEGILKDVFILEHYINVKKVINCFVKR